MRKMNKAVILAMTLVLIVGLAPSLFAAGAQDEVPYIAVVSKGEQHDFWQQVRLGAEAAAEEVDVEITFEGPASEADVQDQVQMLNSALARNPVAIALAALDTNAVVEQLEDAVRREIPVIGFDSGVPNAPEGSIYANASTDNAAAAGLGAEHMFREIVEAIDDASASDPVRIVVMNQDAAGESLLSRGRGFRDRMIELIESDSNKSRSDIRVTGNAAYIDDDTPTSGEAVIIEMVVPASSSAQDTTSAANEVFNRVDDDNIVGIFMSNEGTVRGVLAASNDGADFANRLSGVVAVGFDAGAAQKDAVREGFFLGSITQDPYQIGFRAVTLAYQAYQGESVSDVDTGARFYDASNMDDEEIAGLLYD
ncbi:MAG: ABC transporter substrate-binding protein [Spirochaetaceae bacterium]